MRTAECVLGVLGSCRVGFGNLTQLEPLFGAGFMELCRVCWVYVRARVHRFDFQQIGRSFKYSYASTEKPNTPNTPNEALSNALNLKASRCVGFVSGSGFLCRVAVWGWK